MNKPKAGKVYIFIRARGDAFEHTEFMRHEDGSAGYAVDGFYAVHENHPEAWMDALAALKRLGFIELREAKEAGLVLPGWEPTSDTFVLKEGQVAHVREA